MVREWASQGKMQKGMENLSRKGNGRDRSSEVKEIMIFWGKLQVTSNKWLDFSHHKSQTQVNLGNRSLLQEYIQKPRNSNTFFP